MKIISIVANPISYRLVPRPSRFEISQCMIPLIRIDSQRFRNIVDFARRVVLILQVFKNPYDYGIWNNWRLLLGLVEGR